MATTMSKEYEPSVHFNFDGNMRHLWKDVEGTTHAVWVLFLGIGQGMSDYGIFGAADSC